MASDTRVFQVELTIHQATKIAETYPRRQVNPITVRQVENGDIIVSLQSHAGQTSPIRIAPDGSSTEVG